MEEKSTKSPPKCVMFHHKNPFLKLGPFHTEIISFQPYRAMFHNVSKYIYNYISNNTCIFMYVYTNIVVNYFYYSCTRTCEKQKVTIVK